VQQLAEAGVLENIEGRYYPLGDFDQSLAQLNYYQPFTTGRSPSDFVIRADAAWESASNTADWWNSGCGFVFRGTREGDHYMIYLGLDGYVYMLRVVDGNYAEMGSSYYGKVDLPAGEARLMLAVQGSQMAFFVNDVQVHQRNDSRLRSGILGYTLVSGTNKDFGTRCQMTNVELWELD
jgi:hypothetical protein